MTRIDGEKKTNLIFLVCEGKTEENYFEGFRSAQRLRKFRIKIKTPNAHDALSLVE